VIPEGMRKLIAVVMSLALLLTAYIASVVAGVIPGWMTLCLAPLAIVASIFILFTLWMFAVMMSMVVSGFFATIKIKFLLRYGIETQAVLENSEVYYGPGMHENDPCFKGQCSFTDQRNRRYTFKFSGECYDNYDVGGLGIPVFEQYHVGVKRRIVYWKPWPILHHLYRPALYAPVLRGGTGVYRME
jgi:hypothetical protein